MTSPKIGLQKNAKGVGMRTKGNETRCRAVPTLKTVTIHSRAAADAPLGKKATARSVQSLDGVSSAHVITVDVIQIPIPGFTHDRK